MAHSPLLAALAEDSVRREKRPNSRSSQLRLVRYGDAAASTLRRRQILTYPQLQPYPLCA